MANQKKEVPKKDQAEEMEDIEAVDEELPVTYTIEQVLEMRVEDWN